MVEGVPDSGRDARVSSLTSDLLGGVEPFLKRPQVPLHGTSYIPCLPCYISHVQLLQGPASSNIVFLLKIIVFLG